MTTKRCDSVVTINDMMSVRSLMPEVILGRIREMRNHLIALQTCYDGCCFMWDMKQAMEAGKEAEIRDPSFLISCN